MELSEIFGAVAYKTLAHGELPGGSNQHELNGSRPLQEFFGDAGRLTGAIFWHFFADGAEPVKEEDAFTFYDAREQTFGRTEWRLYYASDFLVRARVGDVLVLVRVKRESAEEIHGLVFEKDSGWLRAASELFDLQAIASALQLIPAGVLATQNSGLSRQLILEELGLDVATPPTESDTELVTREFGAMFPTTRTMSAFARSLVEIEPSDADEVLVRWISREDQLFRALEDVLVGQRLSSGFQSVEEFIQFSLSVQNRRKSRMGHALENHLEALFNLHDLQFERNKVTEGRNTPDFLFPGRAEYLDAQYDPQHLAMLAAKSTCKDRWRQVLTEADRIPVKHLCTLEPGISVAQTDEMMQHKGSLVIPESLYSTYTEGQRRQIMNVAQFIGFIQTLRAA